MREWILILIVIGLSLNWLYEDIIVKPRVVIVYEERIKELNKALAESLSEREASREEQVETTEKVVQEKEESNQPSVIKKEKVMIVEEKDNSHEIAQLEMKLDILEREYNYKSNELAENRKKWNRELDRIENIKGNFKEQNVNKKGKKKGVRTSNADRLKFEQQRLAAINRTNAQISVIDHAIIELRKEKSFKEEEIKEQIRRLK